MRQSRRHFALLPMLFSAAALRSRAENAADLEAVVTTALGSFRIQFYPDKAPRHVAQFLSDARSGYYDGSAFFRVWANGLIQGGDPLLKDSAVPRLKWGSGGFNRLPGELSDLKHRRGTVSAVNLQGKPNSDGSQFFVCVSPQSALDGKYSVFGQVTEGMDVVERISQAAVDDKGLTRTPVRILKITIEPRRIEPYSTATPDELRKVVAMRTTLGTMKLQMEPEWAPRAVQRFLMLAATGWYNGTAFHRIAKGFVFQGGTAETRAVGPIHPSDRWIRPLPLEIAPEVKHVRGIVSMAHGDDPNSAATSFFIVLGPAPHLDGKFTAFAKVIDGMDVLDAFEKEELDGEKPKKRLEIVSTDIENSQ